MTVSYVMSFDMSYGRVRWVGSTAGYQHIYRQWPYICVPFRYALQAQAAVFSQNGLCNCIQWSMPLELFNGRVLWKRYAKPKGSMLTR